MREYIENECLLPSLKIGIPEDVFWRKTPKTLKIYFDAYKQKREEEDLRTMQILWKMGDYVRCAISSSVFVMGMAKSSSLPEYPKCPQPKFENNEEQLSEQQIKNERLKLYAYLKSLR